MRKVLRSPGYLGAVAGLYCDSGGSDLGDGSCCLLQSSWIEYDHWVAYPKIVARVCLLSPCGRRSF